MSIKLFLEGFIIGFGKIIPGVSGALLAMLFNVYEPIIECLSNPKKIKDNFKTIFSLGIGIFFAIFFGSNLLLFILSNYYVVSMSLFIGMMSYGIIPLIKNVKNSNIKKGEVLVSLMIVIILSSIMFFDFSFTNNLAESGIKEFISLFLCGIIDAGSTIIPGISGSAILMMLGFYEKIISSFADINLNTLIPFLSGFSIALIFISKLINNLFKTRKEAVNFSILTFSVFSISYLILNLICITQISGIHTLIVPYLIGLIITYLLETKIN